MAGMQVGVVGAGTMGAGIAQVAAEADHSVLLYDTNSAALEKADASLRRIMARLVEKGRRTEEQAENTIARIRHVTDLDEMKNAGLIIEAIIENMDIKSDVFAKLEKLVDDACILASNTSSLSVTELAGKCKVPGRVIGIHFFNPAPLMKLVEIVPAVQTEPEVADNARKLIDAWGKTTVIARDTPGFIVNRVARPFYSEALRIYEEGLADLVTIDWAMTEVGGFRMGPFTLMDYIGNDVNYAVTESVWRACYYEPRYKPAFTQKRLVDAGYLGRKSGRGYYDYSESASKPEPDQDKANAIFNRIVCMLINEAAEALYWGVASRDDIDLAMTRGVNYPKGLLAWADELGAEHVVHILDELFDHYHEERYRCSPLLRTMLRDGKSFYQNQ